MRKSKSQSDDDEPKWSMPPVLRWKCPTCRTWVQEEMNKCCTACVSGVRVASNASATTAPAPAKAKSTKTSPKMFSDLSDMFGN